jgi:hypothetical protein
MGMLRQSVTMGLVDYLLRGHMTFDEAHKLIKKSDTVSLRRALDEGMVADLSNQFSWTLLMLTAIEGDTAIAELLISRGADTNKAMTSAIPPFRLPLAAAMLR